ncbi:hypothetical protein [Mycolicibacterium obuense]|uniref:hypothetical protein n=1 Tax=Mycolicibacterium obuense TaxID=1807 RepID=UPI000AED4C93|nr:hypothetical protein [Mycolicibacterium obuense]
MASESEHLRAESWVFHYMRGNVRAAVQIELDGPPLRPSAVMSAVIGLLADQGLVLTSSPTQPNKAGKKG